MKILNLSYPFSYELNFIIWSHKDDLIDEIVIHTPELF